MRLSRQEGVIASQVGVCVTSNGYVFVTPSKCIYQVCLSRPAGRGVSATVNREQCLLSVSSGSVVSVFTTRVYVLN